jgi:hypothetical protein
VGSAVSAPAVFVALAFGLSWAVLAPMALASRGCAGGASPPARRRIAAE